MKNGGPDQSAKLHRLDSVILSSSEQGSLCIESVGTQ